MSNVQEYIKNLPKSQNPEVIELENKLPEILYSINTSNDRLASLNHESNETHETRASKVLIKSSIVLA